MTTVEWPLGRSGNGRVHGVEYERSDETQMPANMVSVACASRPEPGVSVRELHSD